MKYINNCEKFIKLILTLIIFIIPLKIIMAKGEMVMVVKIGGIPWFNALEMGIENAAKDFGVKASMIGPTTADPAEQVRHVEDLIAKGVSVIGVVPNDAEVLGPVFARAQAAGIKVVTHESPDQQNNDWNYELIENDEFGYAHAKLFADAMNGRGEYVVYVGSLTVPLHNKWADYAIEYIKKNHPNMKLVTDRFGVAESVDDSFNTCLDVLKAYPNLKGFITFGSQGPPGVARCIQQTNNVGKIVLVGAGSPGQLEKIIKKGIALGGFIWNPIDAGYAFVSVGKLLMDGKQIRNGMNIPGLGTVSVDSKTRNIKVVKLQPVNKETIDMLVDLGL